MMTIFKFCLFCWRWSGELCKIKPYFAVLDCDFMPSNPMMPPRHNALMRGIFFGLGVMFFGLGLLGVIVPGLPTTVFILLAGFFWAKSSERFYRWLANHKIFGKMLTDWQERRAMPRFAKYLAWSMMSMSMAILFYVLPSDRLWIAWIATLSCVATGVWMARLPDA